MSTLGREVKEEQEVDYINQFLRNTFKKNPITGMSETRPLFVFGDKTTISIQASNFTYCSPNNCPLFATTFPSCSKFPVIITYIFF